VNDAFVPVKLRARFMLVGDVFLSEKTNDLWMVIAAENRTDRPARVLTVQRGSSTHTAEIDLDTTILVLTQVPERDALVALRNGLDGRLVDRT
jgi:hypothetical protein